MGTTARPRQPDRASISVSARSNIFGMAVRDRSQLAALGELFERVGPRRVEQLVRRDGAVDRRRDQRLRDQIEKAGDD